MSSVELILVTLLVVAAALAVAWWHGRSRREERRAIQEFRAQRERLEAKFFDLAALSGKPRGLRWVNCDWQRDVTFARDAKSSLMTAFVGVEIQFEAIEGGDMEDVEAVGTIRDASAVFHYQSGRWGTGGKALFNMNPQEAIQRLTEQFRPVPHESHVPGTAR